MTRTWDDLKGSDVIDSRDIIERLDDLEEIGAYSNDEGFEEGEREELAAIKAFVTEYDGYFDDSFRDGVQLIADWHFEDYAEQLADDLGYLNRNGPEWPLTYIDWPAAARALQQDYTSIDIDGTTYWGR